MYGSMIIISFIFLNRLILIGAGEPIGKLQQFTWGESTKIAFAFCGRATQMARIRQLTSSALCERKVTLMRHDLTMSTGGCFMPLWAFFV